MVNANGYYQKCTQSTSLLDLDMIHVDYYEPKPEDLTISFHTYWDLKDNYTTWNTVLIFMISLYDFDNPWQSFSVFQDFTPGKNTIDRYDDVGIIYGLPFLNYTIRVLLADDHYNFACTLFDRRMGFR
ncbi:40139_t:CDS:1 [Gigaspora margarita]|uniref:40139_t:CDS:1 n=1 Tax=Gigaspora margarita TaxID=4874 RepID=A0ABN7V7T6_GIGMA|nr:40139_t:CDS:1 [Gigaspora margarita]